MTPTCPYCGKPAMFTTGNLHYPHRPDLAGKRFWSCAPCDAYVGCHDGTTKPMGRLANAELRSWKMRAHAAFDPRWKGKGRKERAKAYRELAEQLGIRRDDCHIGLFDVFLCRRVVEVCTPPRTSLGDAMEPAKAPSAARSAPASSSNRAPHSHP